MFVGKVWEVLVILPWPFNSLQGNGVFRNSIFLLIHSSILIDEFIHLSWYHGISWPEYKLAWHSATGSTGAHRGPVLQTPCRPRADCPVSPECQPALLSSSALNNITNCSAELAGYWCPCHRQSYWKHIKVVNVSVFCLYLLFLISVNPKPFGVTKTADKSFFWMCAPRQGERVSV